MKKRQRFLHGFTILEILVACAVMAMILVIMVQVVNGILKASSMQNQQMDSVASARRALDVMSVDIERAVVGNNAAILAPDTASVNLFALLTARGAPSGSANHRILAVTYSTNSNLQLYRSYSSGNYSQPNLLNLAGNATTTPMEPLAKGILAISVKALADGTNSYDLSSAATANWATNSYNGITPPSGYKALITTTPSFAASLTNRTRALDIWVAAVDDQNLLILNDTGNLSAAQGVLGADPTTWRAGIDSAAIPSQTKSAIRILRKTIPIP